MPDQPTPHAARCIGTAGEDGFVIQEALEFLGQGTGGRIAALGFLLQTFQADRLQIRRCLRVQLREIVGPAPTCMGMDIEALCPSESEA